MAVAALFGKRSTRFRHVYGMPAQKENCYDNIRVSGNAHDSMFCAVNRQFLAVVLECAGGGGFTVLPIQRTGRIDHNAPKVCGHSAPVMDVKWNPFNDYMVASASDDATVKLWEIPRSGLRSDMTRFCLDLRGHSRRVAYIEWHPTAENILLSAGFDHQSILWNLEMGSPILVSQCHPDVILSLSWNRDGSLYSSTCKDRIARVIDPRSGKAVIQWEPHQGTKTTKIAFLGDTKQLFTTGFSQFAQRQYGLWDMRSLNQGAVKQDNIDSASGALFPFYDHDTRMVYLAGKGDGNIRYYELTQSDPFVYYLSEYQSPHPQRGLGVMPKLGLDTTKCEIFRFYKLHSNRPYCEPISMIAPRKAETFQEDLYPPTTADRPALSAIEWIGGTNRDPILVNIRDPKMVVNCPPMVTARPVQPNRMPNQSLAPVLSYKASYPLNGNGISPEIDENSLPQSVKNIRKLVGSMHETPPLQHDPYPTKIENGYPKEANTALPPVPVPVPAPVVPVSHRNSASSHANGEVGDHRNGLENGHRVGLGHSEQSIPGSSRGSDSVFERSGQKSDAERPPSPTEKRKQLQQQVPEQISGSKRSLTERVERASLQEAQINAAAKQPVDFKESEVVTVTKSAEKEKQVDNNSSAPNGSSNSFMQQQQQQQQVSKSEITPASLPPHHHHHQIHQIRHDEPQAAAFANVVPPPSEASNGAFRPVATQRHPQPPMNLTLASGEKPVSAGFMVQTAVSSPISPAASRLPTQPQENPLTPSQKVIQKLPPSGLDTQQLQAPATTDHSISNNNASDVPLPSPQFRRGATGGNAYQPQQQQSHQQPQNGVVRSPTGRATRPDILDVLQEQLSASSRELRAPVSPNGVHQAVIYSKGPSPQAGHLSLVPPGGVSSNGRNSRNNLSPADRRIRNRTIAGSDGQHAFMQPVGGDFTISPGLNFSSPQRQMPPGQQPLYYQQIAPQQQSHAHRRPPPIPPQPVSRAPVGAITLGTSSSRMPNVAVVDVRDDMAPSIMRPNQQLASPSTGLNRSQTMYIPVADNNGFTKMSGADLGPNTIMMPISSMKNGGGALQFSPGGRLEVDQRARPKDRAHRPRRDMSAAPAASYHQEMPSSQQYYQQQPHQHQPRVHQKGGDDTYDTMSDNDLRSYCRRQRDEIRLLRRQCEAKDQVISRLESELRHLSHQMQQRHGVIGGAGAQAITAVGQ